MPVTDKTMPNSSRGPRRARLLAGLALAAACLVVPSAAEAARTADLGVSQAPSANPVRTGEVVSFAITVLNAGPDGVNSAQLIDFLPKRATMLGITATQGACNPNKKKINCKLGPIAAGASVSLTLRLRVTGQKHISNEVRVSSKAADPKPGNNTDRTGVDVVNEPPILCGGQIATIIGTEGPDNLIGTKGKDVIATFGGNDTVLALNGDDIICGAGGKDRLKGNGGADDVRGGGGGDRLSGGGGPDVIYGRSGNDTLNGGRGNDILRGGGGRNKCYGGGGHTIKRSCH